MRSFLILAAGLSNGFLCYMGGDFYKSGNCQLGIVLFACGLWGYWRLIRAMEAQP
jgi:hypothetical protein